jgi:16S rRNA processing protein RimM
MHGAEVEKLLSIGKILNFHGVQGEAKVGYTANKQERFLKIKKLYVIKDSEIITLTVESVRFHKTYAIIKFEELSTVNDVVNLKGAYLKVPKIQIQDELEEDEFYVDDLIGVDVFDIEGIYIGKVTSVTHLKQDEDLLIIEGEEHQEYLIPFIKDYVPEVNIIEDKIIVKRVPGLL